MVSPNERIHAVGPQDRGSRSLLLKVAGTDTVTNLGQYSLVPTLSAETDQEAQTGSRRCTVAHPCRGVYHWA